jgi:hypothetical protein
MPDTVSAALALLMVLGKPYAAQFGGCMQKVMQKDVLFRIKVETQVPKPG